MSELRSERWRQSEPHSREDNLAEIRKRHCDEDDLGRRIKATKADWVSRTNFIAILLKYLPTMVERLYYEDPAIQLATLTDFQELLSGQTAPIKEVLEAKVASRFVELLKQEEYPKIQLEAARVLINIINGTSENIKVVIDHKAVSIFVKLLLSPEKKLKKRVVLALGNLAQISRDAILQNKVVLPLLEQLDENATPSIQRHVTWTLSKLCEGNPIAHLEELKLALPVLVQLIDSTDVKVLAYACQALSSLSYVTDDEIQAVFETGVCPRIVKLLVHPSQTVVIPALTIIANIVSRGHTQIQVVISAGAIGPLVHLIEAADFGVKEAAWAIHNAILGGTNDQIKFLVSEGCIKSLCDLLVCSDAKTIFICLEGLEYILKAGRAETFGANRDANLYAQMIEAGGGLEKIKNLHNCKNCDILRKAMKILITYWLDA